MELGSELVLSIEPLGGGGRLVHVAGEVDWSSSRELQQALLSSFADGCEDVLVDLDGVDYMDSSGIGALIAGHAEAKAKRGRLAIVYGKSRVANQLRITGLDSVLESFATRADALGHLTRSRAQP